MGREIDEAWIEEAIDRYRRIDELRVDFERAARAVEVTVRSPEGLVEVVVTADGIIRDVRISGQLHRYSGAEVSRAVRDAVTAAADAAAWARQKLHSETFGAFHPLA